MTIGIIIADGADGPESGAARALLPVAASTLVEVAARTLARAGADAVVILSKEPAPLLDAAAARLRRGGLATAIAPDVAAIAGRVAATERVLLVDGGAFVDAGSLGRLLAAGAPALLGIDDVPAHADWERIDAAHRWAGALLVDGATFVSTGRELGEWALSSTLVRRALQADGTIVRAGGGALIAMVPDEVAARALDRALAERVAEHPRGWLDRLTMPAGRLLARASTRVALDPVRLAWGGALATLAAAPLIGAGWRAVGLALILAAILVSATARRLALLGWRGRALDRAEAMRAAALAFALPVLVARQMLDEGTMTAAALAAALVGFLWLDTGNRRLNGIDAARPVWRPEPDGLSAALAPLALLVGWTGGLALLAAWAFAGAAAAQRIGVRD